jgi:hypothetical protein
MLLAHPQMKIKYLFYWLWFVVHVARGGLDCIVIINPFTGQVTSITNIRFFHAATSIVIPRNEKVNVFFFHEGSVFW